MIKPEQLRAALTGRVLAFHEPALRALLATLPARVEAGLVVEPPKMRRFSATAQGAKGAVAVIPVHGVIEKGGGLFSMFFGGTSPELLTDQLRQAVNDPSVAAVVLDVDSPGGAVTGIDELAAEIYNARKQKPVTAVSNGMMASAAYYLGSQASEVLASPSSLTGSIGVYTLHEDDSQALDNLGVKITPVYYGENKTEGLPFGPLSDGAREHMQQMVDHFGQQFEKAVARGRGMKADDVHAKFGQGRVFTALKAVKMGMADRMGTLDDALAKHGAVRPAGARAEDFVVNAGAPWWYLVAAAEGEKTKRVDGKDLTKSCFAYRPNDELENWKLPIESPDDDEEWEKSHIRNAISRWSQTDMPDAEEKDKARGRVKAAAKAHDIEVSDDSLARSADEVMAAHAARLRQLALLEF